MRAKAANFFKGLKPKQRAAMVLLGLGVVLTIVSVFVYISGNTTPKTAGTKTKAGKSVVVSMDNNLLDKNQLLEAQKRAQVAEEALAVRRKEEEEAKKLAMVPPPPSVTPVQQRGDNQKRSAANQVPPPVPPKQPSGFAIPPPPPPMPAPARTGAQQPLAGTQPVNIETEIGGIALISAPEKRAAKGDDKKKDERETVFLPISYMEATLLSGLDAPTTADAKGNPVPVLIRVKTPALLPNEVKANLRGCFVIADGKGNLATERAELVLVTLSCIDKKGRSVIDQPVIGYVVDTDGKAGLRGRVVTKMGAMITRSMIAGLFGGAGDALKGASTSTSLSALGNVQSVNPKDLGMSAVGQGLSNAFKDIQKFYLELAHATMPVIEIGAARPITLVITKGVTLEIKKLSKGGY